MSRIARGRPPISSLSESVETTRDATWRRPGRENASGPQRMYFCAVSCTCCVRPGCRRLRGTWQPRVGVVSCSTTAGSWPRAWVCCTAGKDCSWRQRLAMHANKAARRAGGRRGGCSMWGGTAISEEVHAHPAPTRSNDSPAPRLDKRSLTRISWSSSQYRTRRAAVLASAGYSEMKSVSVSKGLPARGGLHPRGVSSRRMGMSCCATGLAGRSTWGDFLRVRTVAVPRPRGRICRPLQGQRADAGQHPTAETVCAVRTHTARFAMGCRR